MDSVDETIKNSELVDFKNKSVIVLQALLNGYKVKADFGYTVIREEGTCSRKTIYAWEDGLVELDANGDVISRTPAYEVNCFVKWFDSAKEIEILL